MASPSTVLTRGFGSWGTVNELPTLGYGIADSVVVPVDGRRAELLWSLPDRSLSWSDAVPSLAWADADELN